MSSRRGDRRQGESVNVANELETRKVEDGGVLGDQYPAYAYPITLEMTSDDLVSLMKLPEAQTELPFYIELRMIYGDRYSNPQTAARLLDPGEVLACLEEQGKIIWHPAKPIKQPSENKNG